MLLHSLCKRATEKDDRPECYSQMAALVLAQNLTRLFRLEKETGSRSETL